MTTKKRIAEVQKRSGLFWEDFQEQIEKQIEDNQIQIEKLEDYSINVKGTKHRLFEGDNLPILHELKKAKEKFELIYIDPPYNTGNKSFKYTDHFNDSDGRYSHSKWTSFMFKRLEIAKELLADQGAIFISIDDNEQARLKLLCDGIFGKENFVANFIRKNKSGSGHDSKLIAVEYDYVLCYAKDISQLKLQQEIVDVENDKKYRHSDKHLNKRGKYYLRDLDYKGNYSSTMDYPMKMPDGTELFAGNKLGKPNTWRWKKEKVDWGIKHDFVVFKLSKNAWKAYIKQYQYVDNKDQQRVRKVPHRGILNYINSKGSNELKALLPKADFTHPKPTGLIRYFINLFESKSINVLDFFAGSGTSLHATLLQNLENNGKRSCTLITNNENHICEDITYPRIKKAIEINNKTADSKAGLDYFKLK